MIVLKKNNFNNINKKKKKKKKFTLNIKTFLLRTRSKTSVKGT